MPGWLKHVLWAFVALILLANWRSVAGWLSAACQSLGGIFQGEFLGTHDPLYGFAVLGLLMVMITALWAIYWNNHSSNRQGPKEGEK